MTDSPICPFCLRAMTWRELDEQGECNDCHAWHRGGVPHDIEPQEDYL